MNGCPGEAERAAAVIEWFAEADEELDYKTRVGLAGVATSEFRLLRTETDAEACNRLGQVFQRTLARRVEGQPVHDVSYYATEDRYVAVVTFRELVGSEYTMIGLEEVQPFDLEFNHLGGIGL